MIFVNCVFFSNRVRTLWNSLSDIVVKAESVNSFKGRLDRFWDDQEVNWKADTKPTRSRSKLAKIIFYNTNFLCVVFTARWCDSKSSVCPSVTIRYREHIGWNSSKIISRPNSLGPLLWLTPNTGDLAAGTLYSSYNNYRPNSPEAVKRQCRCHFVTNSNIWHTRTTNNDIRAFPFLRFRKNDKLE